MRAKSFPISCPSVLGGVFGDCRENLSLSSVKEGIKGFLIHNCTSCYAVKKGLRSNTTKSGGEVLLLKVEL